MLESIHFAKSKLRSRLLGILFSNPNQKYYLSELARLAKTSAGNVQRELERFVRDELVIREKKGNLVFYVLNPRHALYPEVRSLVLKTVGIEGELQTLVKKHKEILLAILYGSFARKEEKGESDIDLLIVSDKNLEKFNLALSRLESRFHREINPAAYSSEEFRKKVKHHDTFLAHVLNQPYRVLKGHLNEFQKISTRRS